MKEKYLVIGIIIMLFCMNGSGSFVRDAEVKNLSNLSFDENTFYVGGSGPNNYTTIQGAIDDASAGDTVFVYSGIYDENIIINKSINLIGEDRDKTIIDSPNNYDDSAVVQIESPLVSIKGFTIDGDNGARYNNYYGIRILSHYNEIKDNIIRSCTHGIMLGEDWLRSSDYNIISGNIIKGGSLAGIVLDGESSYNIISYNEISLNSAHGIFLRYGNCRNNTINNNNIHSNEQLGIWIMISDSNIIKNNNIVNNGHQCVLISSSYDNQVIENNIYNDDIFSAGLSGSILDMNIRDLKKNWIWSNTFDSNYWGKARDLPQPVNAWAEIFFIGIYFLTFDRNPASEPYDIEL